MQGVFFTRNGKVWGVIGPQFDSPESVQEDSEFSADLSNQRQLHRVIAAKVSLSSNNPGKSSLNPLWIEKAKQAILKWEEKAAWEPEIGFIKEQNAYGVIPPKDGCPKNWMQRAKVVFEEYQLKRESEERRSREAEFQKLQAKREDKDDGQRYLSPQWDSIFNEIGASQNARVAYEFMDRCLRRPSLDAHLQGIVELLRNPKSMRFGWTRTTFLPPR